MKKLMAITLAVIMLASMATVVSAAETTLTTTVPQATYTLNIPENQEIPFGATKTDIGSIFVTDAKGFAYKKDLHVTITYDEFTCVAAETTIPFSIKLHYKDSGTDYDEEINSGDGITFWGKSDGTVEQYYKKMSNSANAYKETLICIASEDWGKALAGEYTTTVTFSAEVVVRQ